MSVKIKKSININNNENIIRKAIKGIKKAYGVILSVMIVFSGLAFYILLQSMNSLSADIRLAFLSQQQIIVSQHMLNLAAQLMQEKALQKTSSEKPGILREQLLSQIRQVQETHHNMLYGQGSAKTAANQSEAIQSIYFQTPANLHASISDFIEKLSQFMILKEQPESVWQKRFQDIDTHFLEKVVPGLQNLARQYEYQAQENSATAYMMTGVLLIGFGLMCLMQTLFIFKPVMRRLRAYKKSHGKAGHAANREAENNYIAGFPDRALFRESCDIALKQAHESGQKAAILHIGLDRFKKLNQMRGHAAGDEILQQVSKRLSELVGNHGICSYFSSDEFLVLLQPLMSDLEAEDFAEKIRAALGAPYHIGRYKIDLSASLGFAVYPDDERGTEKLMNNAGLALSSAKLSGRNKVCRFTEDLRRDLDYRHTIENDLIHAIDHDEFIVFFQPQVDIKDGRTIGVEALVRWQHPRLGLLTPAAFLDVAETTGLIIPISDIVLRKSLEAAQSWSDHGLDYGTVSINISGPQFADPNLISNILTALSDYQFPAQKLSIEVMESVLLDHDDFDIRDILNHFREQGIGVELDDFGTGYASLAHLTELPITRLKIDRAFVQGAPKNQKSCNIINAIIELSQKLKIGIIAEGVESDDQIHYLKTHGCSQVQGFRIARPMAQAQLLDWLQDRKHDKDRISLVNKS